MINILYKFTMPKRKSDVSVECDKVLRKIITLNTKLEIIKLFDNGRSKASISRAQGHNEFTVILILSKCNEYMEQGKVASTSFSILCTILVEMEYVLISWLEDCNKRRIPIGTSNIMVKALSLFSSLNEKFRGDITIFSASRG
jgi:hypothetical protein